MPCRTYDTDALQCTGCSGIVIGSLGTGPEAVRGSAYRPAVEKRAGMQCPAGAMAEDALTEKPGDEPNATDV